MTAETATLCSWCGLELPPYSGRGRPRLAHAGACSRRAHNRQSAGVRFSRFREATTLAGDRSTPDLPWAVQTTAADAIAGGLQVVEGDFAHLPGPAIRRRVEEFEAATRAGKEWDGDEAEHRREVRAVLRGLPEPLRARALAQQSPEFAAWLAATD